MTKEKQFAYQKCSRANLLSKEHYPGPSKRTSLRHCYLGLPLSSEAA